MSDGTGDILDEIVQAIAGAGPGTSRPLVAEAIGELLDALKLHADGNDLATNVIADIRRCVELMYGPDAAPADWIEGLRQSAYRDISVLRAPLAL